MYSSKSDILEQLSETDLIGLTDDAGVGVVDDSVVTRAIEDADATIDAYLQGRYTVPLSTVPGIIRQSSVDIAIYNLFSRRDSFEMPATRKDRHGNTVRFLEKVAAGAIKLGASTPAPTNTGQSVSISSSDRIFSRTKLEDF